MTGSLGQLLFAATVEPLPFVDPTIAAERLGLERHSLACYRSLGIGPAWYKLGRWVRYLPEDLDIWQCGQCALPRVGRLVALSADDPHPERALIDTLSAARFLTITRHCLINYRLVEMGPPPLRMGRRRYYSVGELVKWAEAQRVGGARNAHSPHRAT
jgi:hypothetical protein